MLFRPRAGTDACKCRWNSKRYERCGEIVCVCVSFVIDSSPCPPDPPSGRFGLCGHASAPALGHLRARRCRAHPLHQVISRHEKKETRRLTLASASSHRVEIGGIVATKLCTHVNEADRINSEALARLQGMAKRFVARDGNGGESMMAGKRCRVVHSNLSPPSTADAAVTAMLSRCCRAPNVLDLKIGAQASGVA